MSAAQCSQDYATPTLSVVLLILLITNSINLATPGCDYFFGPRKTHALRKAVKKIKSSRMWHLIGDFSFHQEFLMQNQCQVKRDNQSAHLKALMLLCDYSQIY